MSTIRRGVACLAVLGAVAVHVPSADAAQVPGAARTARLGVRPAVVRALDPGTAQLARSFRVARQEQMEVNEARLEAWEKAAEAREARSARDDRLAARHRALARMIQRKAVRRHAWTTFREVRQLQRQNLRQARIQELKEWRDAREELRQDRHEARDERGDHRKDVIEDRQERREDRREWRQDRREDRKERREDRRDARSDRREDRKEAREDRRDARKDSHH